MTTPRLYPLFADVADRRVLVIGGGHVAARKIDALLQSGACVQVVAETLHPRVQQWFDAGRLAWRARSFHPSQLAGAWLAVAATDNRALNRRVAQAAGQRQVFVNVVDDAELSSFQMPAVVDRAPLQIAISSGGAAPMLARRVRERIEALLDDSLGALASLLHRWRQRIRERWPEVEARRRFLDRLLDGPLPTVVQQGQAAQAERTLLAALAAPAEIERGFVSIVGAGPGDPGLLTLKALRRLQEADVILHDRLVSPEVLAMARRDAERIETGKQAGNHHTPQAQINALMLEHARAGRRVVRLKGGDPFVFGRGGEEIECLREHGIDYEVVPGITAALACAAHAGIPLTHREHAQSLRIATAHSRDSLDALDWPALAQERQTLALYMGVASLGQLRERLLRHGRDPNTPFALIENGSLPQQRVVVGRLAELPEAAAQHQVQSPALLILGEVAGLAERLHWFGAAPLRASSCAVSEAA